jgi:phage terminase small subunit
MPALQNPKHERFAQELAKGKSQVEAYVEAGYKPNDGHAARLAGDGRISARVAEILDRGAIRTEITLASLMQEAAEIQAAALKAKQHSAAVAALTAKAKLAGLWIDKAENTNRNVADPAEVSDAELAAVLKDSGGEGTAEAPVDKAQLN